MLNQYVNHVNEIDPSAVLVVEDERQGHLVSLHQISYIDRDHIEHLPKQN